MKRADVTTADWLEEIKKRANMRSLMRTDQSTEFTPNILPPVECEDCRDAGGFFYTREGTEYWRDCHCVERKRVERLMSSSNITEEFQKKTFDNFEQDGRPAVVIHAYQTAMKYVEVFEAIRKQRKNSIALLGRPGCGKTHLLMAVANSLLKQGVQVVYFPWVEGFNEIKDDFDLLEERTTKLKRCQVLYIDDMFKGRKEPTDFQLEQLFGIINYRYLENKPILISSEKSISDMCKFDEGIASRITEMCKDYRVTLQGGIELNYRFQ